MKDVEKLYGIYHADGGLVGELAYIFGKYAGNVHCSLCDITHNKITMKKEWKIFSKELPIPFDLLHLNERTAEVIAASENKTPCVLVKTNDSLHIILSSEELENCNKSVKDFTSALNNKLNLLNI